MDGRLNFVCYHLQLNYQLLVSSKISLNLMWTFYQKRALWVFPKCNFIKWDWMRCSVHILWCPWPSQCTLFTDRLHNEVQTLSGGASLYKLNLPKQIFSSIFVLWLQECLLIFFWKKWQMLYIKRYEWSFRKDFNPLSADII